MVDWPNILSESPIDWLLEKSNPSVRYFALRAILGKPEDDSDVLDAKQAIRESAIVQKILQKQKPEGYWETPNSPYLPKYKSSYWTLMVLGRLGLDRTVKSVEKACEFIFQFQQEDGGFLSESAESALRGYIYRLRLRKVKKMVPEEDIVSSLTFESQLSCLTGNMVAALARLGYADDSRVKKAVDWLVGIQNKDGGWLCPYWKAHARDKHACFMGTICALEAFSEIQSTYFDKELKASISKGSEFLLMHHLFKADHHDYRVINRAWLELSFPWFSGYNILRGLDVVTKLGYVNDNRLEDAVEALLEKRQKDGDWILENSPIGRMQANLEGKGEPSKWITLIALRILKRLGI